MAIRLLFSFTSVFPLFFVALQSAAPSSFDMKFKKLHNGIACKCIDGECKINTEDSFYRRLFDKKITIKDFESWAEMGKKIRNPKPNCDVTCSHRALSITKQVNEVNIEEFYKTTIKIKPNAKHETPFYCKLKFTNKCGKVKLTASKRDAHHHSFYKSDDFDFTKIVFEDIKPMPK